jgi:hypothetical protein
MSCVGSDNKLVITAFPPVNDDIITGIKIENGGFNEILIEGNIYIVMKIFISSPK